MTNGYNAFMAGNCCQYFHSITFLLPTEAYCSVFCHFICTFLTWPPEQMFLFKKNVFTGRNLRLVCGTPCPAYPESTSSMWQVNLVFSSIVSDIVCRIRIKTRIRISSLIFTENCHKNVEESHKH